MTLLRKQQIASIILLSPVIFFWLIQIFNNNLYSEILLSLLPDLLIVYLAYLIIGLLLFLTIKLLSLRSVLFITISSLIILSPFYYKILNFYYAGNTSYSNQATDNTENLTIMSFNILFLNKNLQPTINTIHENNPDIILFYELTLSQYKTLKNALPTDYIYSSSSTAGNGIFAKMLPTSSEEIMISDSLSYRKILLNLHNQVYTIYAIHPPAPITQSSEEEKIPYMNSLVDDINANSADKVIIAGDFNMAPWAASYEDFNNRTKHRFTDTSAGQGFDQTWSWTVNPFVALTHIDHIWVTSPIKVFTNKSIHVEGSDHKAVLTSLY